MRILAYASDPDGEAPELEWINSRVRLLGESYAIASKNIDHFINIGKIIIVRIEEK